MRRTGRAVAASACRSSGESPTRTGRRSRWTMVPEAKVSSCGCTFLEPDGVGCARRQSGPCNPVANLKVYLSCRPYISSCRPGRWALFHQESTMRLSKVTYALIAAGVGAGLATGYTHLDSVSVSSAHAATQPVAAALLTAPTTAAGLPDFTATRRARRGFRRQHQHLPREGQGRHPTSRTSTRTAPITNSSSVSAASRVRRACVRRNLRAAWDPDSS